MTFGVDPLPKKTGKEVFLDEMNQVVPWAALVALIKPHARSAHQALGGRPPFPIEVMLRIHCVQLWRNLSDPAMKEELHERPLYRRVVGLDSAARMPDETTILRSRHLLEKHELAPQVLATINAGLAKHGLMLKTGTVVDATIIAAPISTKNKQGERDPEMHQTRRGKQWHFGMKAQIGVDADSGLVQTVIVTAANVNGVMQAGARLHGQEKRLPSATSATGARTSGQMLPARPGPARHGTSPFALDCDASSTRSSSRSSSPSNSRTPRPAYGQRSSTPSGSSSSSSGVPRRATAACSRPPRG